MSVVAYRQPVTRPEIDEIGKVDLVWRFACSPNATAQDSRSKRRAGASVALRNHYRIFGVLRVEQLARAPDAPRVQRAERRKSYAFLRRRSANRPIW
ncbi:MAG: hypothetical protein R3A47_08010 [Polyangiales bacterium]